MKHLFTLLIVSGLLGLWGARAKAAAAGEKPNVIFILADDLGYGELGCYGQQLIKTPCLDQMAREGMRFTQFYSGATVCAPSRSVLMTGLHHGHTRVRGNAGMQNPIAQALRPEDTTVAKVLRDAGYATALVGKWGLGDDGAASMGMPRKQGFDYFFGFLNQRHAHNHYPDYLWRNEEKVKLPNDIVPIGEGGSGYSKNCVVTGDDLFADEAIKFVSENKGKPFFLYWSMVIPHGNNERTRELGDGTDVSEYGQYAGMDWPKQNKGHAVLISRMDAYVGRMMEHLKKLGLAEKTLVLFTSDNGPHKESGHDAELFRPYGPVRGYKRDLHDGGIRVPMIAWWPGKIAAGTTSAHVGYFGDFMATAAELGGAKPPANLDSISFVPAMLGRVAEQKSHEFIYWEFHEGGFSQAALYKGRWKGIRLRRPAAPLELYDLHEDLGEKKNVAAQHPEIVSVIDQYLRTARSESADWPTTPKPTAAP